MNAGFARQGGRRQDDGSCYKSSAYRECYYGIAHARTYARNRTARQIVQARALVREHKMDCSPLLWLDSASKYARVSVPRPGSRAEYDAAWETVRHLETDGVDLSGLPCGTDDAAYERAMCRYHEALAIVTHYGRPLP